MDDRAAARTGRRYRAFISYSREDRRLASALADGLQRLAKPARQKRIFDVFLDLGDIPAGGSLPERLRSGLEQSDFLILVASPAAAASYWVGEEVEHWVATHGVGELIIVLADGDLSWDSHPPPGRSPGWADGGADVLPALLRDGCFTDPPTWVDFREQTALVLADTADLDARLSLDDPSFKINVARVQAPLRGPAWSPSDIVGEDLDLWRSARRRRKRAIAALVALAIVSTVAGILALAYARRSAAQERTALSRQLAAQSSGTAGTSLDLGLLLAVEAFRTDDTPDAFGGLVGAAARAADVHRILRAHARPLRGAVFSPDGRFMASAALGGSVVLWDTATWRPIGEPLRPDDPGAEDPGVRSLAFDSSGDVLAAGDFEGRVHVWDLSTPDDVPEAVIRSPSHDGGSITQLAFGPGGRRVVTAGGVRPDGVCEPAPGHPVVIVDLVSRTERHLRDVPECVTAAAFSPDGRTIAIGREDGAIELVDAASGDLLREPWTAHVSPTSGTGIVVSSLAFDADGSHLASGGWDRTAVVWSVDTAEAVGRFDEHADVVRSVTFVDAGETIASGDRSGGVAIWTVDGGQLVRQLSARQSGEVWQVAMHPDGRWLASASTDETIAIWDLGAGEPLSQVLHGGSVDLLEVLDDRNLVVAAGSGVITDASGTRRPGLAWTRLADGVPHPIVLDSAARALARDGPSGDVVIGHADGTITYRDTETWEVTATIGPEQLEWCLDANPGPVTDLATDPESDRVIVAFRRGAVAIVDDPRRDPTAGRCLRVDGVPFAVTIAPGGRIAAIGNGDSRVLLVDLATGDPRPVVATAEIVTSLAFDGSGSQLAVGGSDGDIGIVDVGSGSLRGAALEGHIALVSHLAFHPDGRMLASVSRDRSVLLWNVATGLPITDPLVDHGLEVFDVEWYSGGRGLVTAGGNVLVWDLGPDRLEAAICRTANRNLTSAEWAAFANRVRGYRATCPEHTVDTSSPSSE